MIRFFITSYNSIQIKKDWSWIDCVIPILESEYDHVDTLINNAGLTFNPYTKTRDGFETHLQVNYLGHFLLTSLLIGHLKEAEQGRIINVSAHAYAAGKMTIDDPLNIGTWAPAFHARDAFSHSKLAILMASRKLAKELKGSKITVNVCTPGTHDLT